MTGLEAFGVWWSVTILPWAIDSTVVALALLAVARLGRRATPTFRKGVATIGLMGGGSAPLELDGAAASILFESLCQHLGHDSPPRASTPPFFHHHRT